MGDPGEERQVPDPDIAGDLDLLVVVDAEGDHAVDVGGTKTGVAYGGFDCLAGQLHLAAARFLGELGLPDPDERGLAANPAGAPVHASTPSSRLSTAVPETWSPRLLAPLNVTSMNPSPSADDLSVTDPVKRIGSFG